MSHATADSKVPLDEWITRQSIPFDVASEDSFSAAADRLVAALGDKVELLGFGEALHGGEEILRVRNRLFQRLVEKDGFSAIAIESSFPRARLVNEYIQGRGSSSYDGLLDTGFGHGMGQLTANRDLVEWMRAYNLDPKHGTKLHFYGFDIPSGTMGIASPGAVLGFVTDYLAGIVPKAGEAHRQRVRELLGDDAQWENPAVYMDPSKSIALSPNAVGLRVEVEDLIAELRSRRPELVAGSSEEAYREALHYGVIARELLNFHAAMGARKAGQSPATVLGTRDASMAENLSYILEREQGRGKVFVFAHNSHLQRGLAVWPGQKYWGTDDDCEWWPAGSHLAGMLGERYAVVGSAVGVSKENGIGVPEAGSLESRLSPLARPGVLLPTRGADFGGVTVRGGSGLNPTYVPLNGQVGVNFDWVVLVGETGYNLGGPPLQSWDVKVEEKKGH